ncbi:MAG: hypothetical protein ACM3PP_11090 [Candidatus Saccharibacteria bacterium]
MSGIVLGIICGLVFGVLDVMVMIPIKFEDHRKRIEAMSGAFLERFMLGFIIPNLHLGIHPALTGALLGLGLSVPTAIITRAYGPIIIIGLIGGVVIGFITKMVIG